MDSESRGSAKVVPFPRRFQIVPSQVLGTLIFVVAEAMLFLGFISAFMIVKGSAGPDWPPAGQPRLPIEETAFNTAALLLSGVMLFVANRAYATEPAQAKRPLLASMLLGAFFVLFQGYEWLALIGEGLTLTLSTHGSFFYLIVGTHALHAIGGLALLVSVWWRLQRGRLASGTFYGAQVFWYFVVGLWPLLYWQVYL